jgi:hypothetical protein
VYGQSITHCTRSVYKLKKKEKKKFYKKNNIVAQRRLVNVYWSLYFWPYSFFGECLNKLQPYIFSLVAGACK